MTLAKMELRWEQTRASTDGLTEADGWRSATRLLAALVQHECDKSPDAFTMNPKTPHGITQDPKKANPFLEVAR
jgi:hypothetical protein